MLLPEGLDRRSMTMSVSLHTGLFALAWFTSLADRSPVEFLTYEIELVSPPASVQADIRPAMEEMVVERPEPATVIEDEVEEEVVPLEEPEERELEPPPQENRPREELSEIEEESSFFVADLKPTSFG